MENSEIQNLVEKIAEFLEIDLDEIFIFALSEGSTVVDGQVSSDSSSDASSKSNKLSSNSDSLGYSVLESSIDVYYDGQTYTEDDDDGSILDDVPLGAIIGGAVGGVVLIVIIVLVVYKCRNKSPEVQINDESELDITRGNPQNNQLQGTQAYNAGNVKVIYN